MKDVFDRLNKMKISIFLKFIFGFYLVMAGISQIDPSQIGERPHRFAHGIVGSLLTQKWSMFAPRPLAFSQQIQYQCDSFGPSRIWLEELKESHARMASISRQKMIFYFEDYLSVINTEIEVLQKRKIPDVNKALSNFSMNLPVVQDLAILLSKECHGRVPVAVDFVKIWIKPKVTERFQLWGN